MSSHARFLVVCALALPACGSSEEGAAPSAPPSWIDAPTAPVALGQGQSVTLPLTATDPNGDPVTVTVSSANDAVLETSLSATADSLELHATYLGTGATNAVVTLADGRGQSASVTVEVDIRAIRWLGHPTWTGTAGPEAREHGSIVIGGDGTQAFLFGGTGYSPQMKPLSDLWRYDVDADSWTPITPTGDVPPPAGSRRIAQAPGSDVAYAWGGYGGANGATNYDDLYRITVEGQTLAFQLLTQVGTPPARSLHGFAYDPLTDRFVLFGGAANAPLNDTWLMTLAGDVATWTELTPTISPSKRYGFFAGFDAEHGRLLLFSGAQGFATIDAAEDTWALDLRVDPPAWEKLAEGAVPAGRRNGAVTFDPSGPRLFVLGGTADGATTEPGLFAFDARPGKASWAELPLADEPPLRSSGFGFYDAMRDRNLMGFGNSATGIYRDWGVLGY
jgi:hypothetical protein